MRSLASVSSALLLSVAVLHVGATLAAAVVCPTTGEPAPDVITVMASKTAPATDAWIIQPDCSVETVSVLYATIFQLENKNVEHVISIPSDATYVAFFSSPLSRGANFSAATKANNVVINKFDAALLDKLVLPSTVTTLYLDESPYTSLDDFVFPPALQNLALRGNLIKSFKNVKFPTGLHQLFLGDTMTTIDFDFPPNLTMFYATGQLPAFERIKLPDTITDLGLTSSNTSVVRGIKWPSKLKNLALDGNSFTNFEIRQSDVELFSNVFLGWFPADFAQVLCTDPTGVLTTLKSMTVCVISDERFETLYGDSLVPPPPSVSAPSSTPANCPSAGSERVN